MYQLAKTSLLVHSLQIVQPGSVSVSHHTVMSAYHAGKKSKSNDALAVVMFKTFIVDQCYIFCQDRTKHLLIAWLFLFCMREKEIDLCRNQLVDRNFLYAEEDI